MNGSSKLLLGCSEKALEVPLFTELYGYGPFKGRRNRGTRDPLYCRAVCFSDGQRKLLVIGTDAVVTDDTDARILRVQISAELGILPQDILFSGTHTHSGPAMSFGIGWGEMDPEYLAHWRATVRRMACKAVADLSPVQALAGRAPIRKALGSNRADPEKNETDPEIRFVRFLRPDGQVKLLLHNHGMHGVVFGPAQMLVSADWMGETNRLIRERGLAEMPFFFNGAAGDVNVLWTHKPEQRDENLAWIAASYIDDLAEALDTAQEIAVTPLDGKLETFEFPTVQEDAGTLRKNAELLRETWPFAADRYLEMAELADRGHDFRVLKDLQRLRIGDLAFYAFPGEPFTRLGREIMDKSPYPMAMPVGYANGNGRYFPTPETFDRFPVVNPDKFGYGYYEIWAGGGRYMPRYQRNIAEFIIGKLLSFDRN